MYIIIISNFSGIEVKLNCIRIIKKSFFFSFFEEPSVYLGLFRLFSIIKVLKNLH